MYLQEGTTTKTVGTVYTTSQFTACKETWNRLLFLGHDGRVGSDLQTTHSVMKDRSLRNESASYPGNA